jgi:transglutaminase-like putative cysteine protease
MNRVKSFLAQRLSLLGLLSLVLTLVALNIVAHGLAGIVRGLDSSLLSNLVLYGTLTGWILALVPLTGWLTSCFTFLIAVSGVFLRIGRIVPALMALLHNLYEVGEAIQKWEPGRITPDWTPVVLSFENLTESIYVLLTRVGDWFLAITKGAPFYDPVAAAFIWGLALWVIAAWAGWFVNRRKQPLSALVPAGVILGTTLAFSGSKPTALLWFLGTMILIMAIVTQEDRQRRWQETGLRFSPSMWHGLAIWATLLSLVLIVTAALTQSLSLRKLIDLASIVTREQSTQKAQMADSLGLEEYQGQGSDQQEYSNRVQSPVLPRRHIIGSGSELSEKEVMVIRVTSPMNPPLGADTSHLVPRYYWRSHTYDRYTGRIWITDIIEPQVYPAGETIHPSDMEGRRNLKLEVITIFEPTQMVYSAGTLVTTDRDFTVEWRSPEDDFGALFTAPTWISHVDSLVLDADEAELRASGNRYPDWVRTRYLTLPDTVPERVLALARDLTATAPTPYDRALAIESYLREFPYTLELPPPPMNQDVVDYFIFDLQKGYCDYYATSMAVLARAAGLPARIAVGYASGIYDMDLEAYVVSEDQAHSWVEIYFPGYGWVDFEPTAELPTRERKGTYLGIEPTKLDKTFDLSDLERSRLSLEPLGRDLNWNLIFLISLAATSMGGVTWLFIDRWRLTRLSTPGVAVEVFRRMRINSRHLRTSAHVGETAYELYDSLTKRLKHIAQESKLGRILAPAVGESRFLTEQYVQVSYSSRKLDTSLKSNLITTWRRLRWRLWFTWVMTRLRK